MQTRQKMLFNLNELKAVIVASLCDGSISMLSTLLLASSCLSAFQPPLSVFLLDKGKKKELRFHLSL